jgi:hypothetical protein
MKQHKIIPEFSRPLIVDRVPRKGSHEVFAAEPKELTALAKRFYLVALHALKARLLAVPWRGGGLKVTGSVEANLDRISVVSLETFNAVQKFDVERYFLPPSATVDPDLDDADPIVEGIVDLGELVSETLGLELDPYPRQTGEEFAAFETPKSPKI